MNHFQEDNKPLDRAVTAGSRRGCAPGRGLGWDDRITAGNIDTQYALCTAIIEGKPAFVDMIFEFHPDLLRDDPRAKQHHLLHLATVCASSDRTSTEPWMPSARIITQLTRNGADPTVLNPDGYSYAKFLGVAQNTHVVGPTSTGAIAGLCAAPRPASLASESRLERGCHVVWSGAIATGWGPVNYVVSEDHPRLGLRIRCFEEEE